jgi:bifunctional DNase/RNase
MNESDLIPVSVVGFAPAQQSGGFVIVLKEDASNRCLPIVVGPAEAQAISMILNPTPVERPMTHDTFKNIIDALRGEVRRVVITKLVEHTFFADIWLRNASGDNFHLDARPSDAIAIALQNTAPICIARSVMDEAGVEMTQETGTPAETDTPAARLAAAQEALQKALDEERYEDAARLRDEVRRLQAEQGDATP